MNIINLFHRNAGNAQGTPDRAALNLADILENELEHISKESNEAYLAAQDVDDSFHSGDTWEQVTERRDQKMALYRERERLVSLRRKLMGGEPDWGAKNPYEPQPHGWIDQLRTGEMNCSRAEKSIRQHAQAGRSALCGEAFEGVSPRTSLRDIFGREQFTMLFSPIPQIQKAVLGVKIEISKDKSGKPVTTEAVVRELLSNGDKLPEGVTVHKRGKH